MHKDFWLERWQREETGFHEQVANAYLRKFLPGLHLARGSRVFVPLCGKSVDMRWLREQEHTVVGVELSNIAVQAFFGEHGYTPHCSGSGKFERCDADGISILCGDFFDLQPADVAATSAVYDRASMVALPPEMRERYVKHLVSIVPPGTKILLITFDYPQPEMQGPPFAVSAGEVETLYRPYADIHLLAQIDVLADNPRFQQRGLSRLQERVYLLTLKQ